MSKVQISRYQIILALIWSVLGTGLLPSLSFITQFAIRDRLDDALPCLWSSACCPLASRHCSFVRSLTELSPAVLSMRWGHGSGACLVSGSLFGYTLLGARPSGRGPSL